MSASAETHLSPKGDAPKVVTRFAPSPTGFLHIGGARTALFNWLLARHFGGSFLLRVEDTDKARSTQPAIDAILDGMQWLGLDWDGEVVYQSERAERHAEVAHVLLDAGHAYKCFATAEELEAMRAEQRAKKLPMRYDGRWRDRDPGEAPEGAPYVVRIKAPQSGELVIEDAVQGRVKVNAREIDDYVLLRSDGTPTYMLAVVVDDHDMGVTHVVRGDDHLNNAFRQLVLIRAMEEAVGGWPEPVYAHIPLIHGNDGAKLSKRHGAMGVDAYRDELGILSDAMVNYLLRLGWGYGDTEKIDRKTAIELFSLDNVGRSPSRFDLKKLLNLNGIYIRESDDNDLAREVAPRIAEANDRFGGDLDRARLVEAMPVLKPRARDLNELAENAQFLFRERPIAMDEKARSLLDDEAIELMKRLMPVLVEAPDWKIDDLERLVNSHAEAENIGLGKIAQPLRAALTGQARSPGIFDVLVLLGRDEALARIRDQIAPSA